jgi:hypothetical protein
MYLFCRSDGLTLLFARIARLFSDEMLAIASSAGPAMFGSVRTVLDLSASIRALHPVDTQNESTQWQSDR